MHLRDAKIEKKNRFFEPKKVKSALLFHFLMRTTDNHSERSQNAVMCSVIVFNMSTSPFTGISVGYS